MPSTGQLNKPAAVEMYVISRQNYVLSCRGTVPIAEAMAGITKRLSIANMITIYKKLVQQEGSYIL